MERIEGVLEALGNATVFQSGGCRYSVVEFAGRIIQGLVVTQGLDNFLQRGLTHKGSFVLHVDKRGSSKIPSWLQ